MDMYSLSKPLLFLLDPERAHDLTLKSLKWVTRGPAKKLFTKPHICKSRQVMGLSFPNPVGLAAGLDKNGAYIDGLAALGFGFIEVGTITPRPQPGNPKPRLFRIKQAEGIINRFGFNNLGVDNLVENVRRASYKGILGINIGKNFDTPNERAIDDYLICLRKVYAYATVALLNRDVRVNEQGEAVDSEGNLTAHTIVPIFDAEKVAKEIKAQVQITEAFGQQANKAVGDFVQNQRKVLREQLKNAATEEDKQSIQTQLDDLLLQERVMNVLIGAVTGLGGTATLKESLSIAATEMRRITIEDSEKSAGITDGETELSNATGISAGVRDDGFKNRRHT